MWKGCSLLVPRRGRSTHVSTRAPRFPALRRVAVGAVVVLLLGSGVSATAAESGSGFIPSPDPNTAPSTRPAAGPEKESAGGARPESGDLLQAGPPLVQSDDGWRVNTPRVELANFVFDDDGDRVNLTFEVWTADPAGKPDKQVDLTDDNPWGVLVSDYVDAGHKAKVTVEAGKLKPNVDYLFHTNAYDGSLYETSWSRWEQFRIELPVDLTLPAPDHDAPDPDYFDAPPNEEQTKPLGSGASGATSRNEESCGPVTDGRQLCFGPPLDKPDETVRFNNSRVADWCNDGELKARATRYQECENRRVPAYLKWDGEIQATAYFAFQRHLFLDGEDHFTEILTIKATEIPEDFARIDLRLAEHLCNDPCTPVEPEHEDWTATPSWEAGDTHEASLTTVFEWDASVAGKKYLFKPDIKLDADLYGADGRPRTPGGYQWSSGYDEETEDLDRIRCDTLATYTESGCVFVNSAPTYIFNAAKFPQAAAHAWLIQTKVPNHPGSEDYDKPLYYMGDSAQNNKNRRRMCPTGWAKENGDESALDGASDELNCDEFAFASTYNSGGMKESEGGLNEAVPPDSTTGVPNGKACVQTFAKKHDSAVHLYNIDGTVPTWHEVCGRSAISGVHNQQSMGARFSAFMQDMRIMDKDPYWLDTRMSGQCKYLDPPPGSPVICTMTAK